ncbi:MAG: hypothetical protein J0M08_06770 [Bacteroidetes bacterium]|nr:hypothetical protein [Bacteroidota bacterium]
MKNLYLLTFLLATTITLPGQVITSDPIQEGQNKVMIKLQAQSLWNAVDQFKKMKEHYDVAVRTKEQIVELRDMALTIEERLKEVGDIKNLRLNNIGAILDRVMSLKEGRQVFMANKFMDIASTFESAFLKLDNSEIYENSYSGVASSYSATLDNPRENVRSVQTKINSLNSYLEEATKTSMVADAQNQKMKMNLAIQYKAISDELIKVAKELNVAINIESAIALDPGQRMEMMDKVLNLQIKAAELEERSAQLLKEATTPTEESMAMVREMRINSQIKQMSLHN